MGIPMTDGGCSVSFAFDMLMLLITDLKRPSNGHSLFFNRKIPL